MTLAVPEALSSNKTKTILEISKRLVTNKYNLHCRHTKIEPQLAYSIVQALR